MKLAILIYGRLDKSGSQYNNIINSIDNSYTIDFFCSSDNSTEEDLNIFINKYKPIYYVNDKIDITNFGYFSEHYMASETNLNNMICHFINKYRVYNLLSKYIEESNTQYDIIMYLRADIQFNDKFDFEYPKVNNIYIPCDNDYRNGINDQISYGDQNVMKIYSNLINNCKYLLENNLTYVHPENLTLANLKVHNLIINRFKLSYHIVRC